ncbi:hypothetical protein NE237_008158 [Protea cynaroides]|uniref:Uncharacterized protein n=1 Tax=Protea cynaroides TaxID=273540 RepID=A0A9Q0QX56_9MAGN|nr:hypothetical protein NE237_008158 [Protea cynaroides]
MFWDCSSTENVNPLVREGGVNKKKWIMTQYRSETESSTKSVKYFAVGDMSSSIRRERVPKPSSSELTFGNRFEEEDTGESPLEEAPLASDSSDAAKKRNQPAISSGKRNRKKKRGKPTNPMLDSVSTSKIESTVYSKAALLQLRVEYQFPLCEHHGPMNQHVL